MLNSPLNPFGTLNGSSPLAQCQTDRDSHVDGARNQAFKNERQESKSSITRRL